MRSKSLFGHSTGRTPRWSSILNLHKNQISLFHGHTTEVGNKVSAIGMAGKTTFCAFLAALSAQRKKITAMTTPIRTNI